MSNGLSETTRQILVSPSRTTNKISYNFLRIVNWKTQKQNKKPFYLTKFPYYHIIFEMLKILVHYTPKVYGLFYMNTE